ncbi:MAG: diguanylate cyclase [Prevotella sp.]|nr:diguanylate cyclase [Prevotella sp.]
MKKNSFSLRTKIMLLSALPTAVLGLILSSFCTFSTYRNVYNEIYNELHSMCISIYEFVLTNDVMHGGDAHTYEDMDNFFSGIKNGTGVDVSYFKGGVRYITTITDTEGHAIKGTVAAPEVLIAVLDSGSDFYSDDVEVNGVRYFGYYIPVSDADGVICGMTFAGKSRENAEKTIMSATLGSLLISVFSTCIALGISLFVSAKMVAALEKAVVFINKVSEGDTECEPDKRLIERGDEIGVMGRSVVKLQQSLKALISTDPLTGLLNRRACNIRLNEIYKNSGGFTAIIGDIDFFKKFNDKYGHFCGDEVLKTLSAVFRDCVGDSGFTARWGGEEFLIIINSGEYTKAVEILDDIRSVIKENGVEFNGEKLNITMTFGVQRYEPGLTAEEVINLADEKLYYGKNHGRNRIIEVLSN